ncbi:uncharacterized protein LOC131468184 [Solea solea]|uniref:uncharacterized protein LOC131468184 n=1 Tax=Solea solea TaxID=90069 RepID=UPI00272A9E7A|nr:uncharacterized protein LOC131468184 [Solea solea]
METGYSESGVYYQAVPAFGADGKNVLKLIPVKMVNGQFFQEQISKPRMESTTQRFMRVSSTPHQIQTAVTPSATEQAVTKKLTIMKGFPSQVGLVPSNLVSNPPPQQQTVYGTAPFATNSPGRPRQLPVTVKSPVLPRGQLIQIPPNAQVRTVPASELPVGVKKQIFKSSVKGSDEPTVIYVSPVTTVIQAAAPAHDSALHTLKPPLKLIPKASNRPNGPTRWVIEEGGCTKAQSHNPPSAPLIPHILNAVKKTEKAGQQHFEVKNGAASDSSLGKSSCDALVMCNGKVFFVAEKRSLPDDMGESKLNKTGQQTVKRATSQTCQNMSVITPHEVIDLCDDDGQEDSIPISHQEDDNVIFVSYIPPKSEARSVQASRRSDKINTSHSDSVKGLERSSGGTGEVSTEVSNVTDNKESNVMTQHSTSTLQLGEMRDEVEAGTPAGPSNCATHTEDESSLSPEEREMADHQLRKMFEIRSDVKIHLQRIDEAPAELVLTESVSSESDHQNQKSDTCRSGKGVTQEDQSADITPLQHSPLKLNSHSLPAVENCPSGPSAVTETLCGVGNAPVINYVEPIDEDFLSSNEDTADQGRAQNTNTRRIVRTRKRTTCPCCIPGSLEPAMKYTKVDDLGKWTCGTQQTGKKGTQKKTARKGGTTSGNGFITGRSKQVTVRDGLSTASMHSELKSHKHMKRNMDSVNRLEVYIPVEAEVKNIPLCSLPSKVLRKMGLPPTDIQGFQNLSSSPEGIWICPAVVRRKGQTQASPKGQSLIAKESSLLASQVQMTPGPLRMSFVSSNKAAYNVLRQISGADLEASLPQGSAPQTYGSAVVIYRGHIYLSMRKHDLSLSDGSSAPSTSSSSASSSKRQKKLQNETRRKKKKHSSCKDGEKDVAREARDVSSTVSARPVPLATPGEHSVDSCRHTDARGQQETQETASAAAAAAAGRLLVPLKNPVRFEPVGGSSDRHECEMQELDGGDAESSSSSQSGTRTEPLSVARGSASLAKEYDDLAQEEKIAKMKARLRQNEAAFKNLHSAR